MVSLVCGGGLKGAELGETLKMKIGTEMHLLSGPQAA